MSLDLKKRELIQAHGACLMNRRQIELSDRCGCTHCQAIFSSQEVKEWVSETTAVCPYCKFDSVIGDASGYPITHDFLVRMRETFVW